MKKSRPTKKRTIDVREDDVTVIQIEADKPLIEFYKKETGRSRVSVKGLSDFCSNLIRHFHQR
jgi:hypothetical protein